MAGGWIIEVDIRKFFDTLDHAHLRSILRQRVVDGVLLRLIDKWLNAGIQEGGALSYPDSGSPQGGVISPLLANIYLHEVLDRWFERDVKPRMTGKARLFRYADDAVFLFAKESDARRVMEVLPKRFGRYGLTLHPNKTRLTEFRRPDRRPPNGGAGPGTFDLLGFTHLWGRSLKGKWIVKRRTARDRLARAIKRITEWCRQHRHDPVRLQWQVLTRKLLGHFEYYGIVGNFEALVRFRHAVIGVWRKWLDRRSQRARMTWLKMHLMLKRYALPTARITHKLQPG